MLKLLARWGSFALAGWRLLFGGYLVFSQRANDVAILFGLSEVVMSSFALVNSRWARIDASPRGWLVPGCYMLGFVVTPVSGAAHPFLWLGLSAVGLIRLWCLIDLGVSYSCGPPAFSGDVATTGLYSQVRHPMQSLGLAMRVLFVIANPAWINAVGLLAMSLAAVVACLGEERFLLRESLAYQAYAARVRWRLLPGVW